MPSVPTRIADLINPQVMADMLPGKINSKIVVRPFAKIDNKLAGQPEDTIMSYICSVVFRALYGLSCIISIFTKSFAE